MKKALIILSVSFFTFLIPNGLNAQFDVEVIKTFNRVILVKFNESADPELKKEVSKLYREIKDKLEGLEWVHITDLISSSQGYDQAITLTFETQSVVEEYEKHPIHTYVRVINAQIIKESATYEFWDIM